MSSCNDFPGRMVQSESRVVPHPHANVINRTFGRIRSAGYLVLTSTVLFGISVSSHADDSPPDFAKQIAPILAEHCLRCHSEGDPQGDISLATANDLRQSEYIVAGDPDGSYLLQLVMGSDGEPPAMPKEGKPLSAGQISLLRRWISAGARWPREIVIREKSKADESWWSLQPLNAASPPALQQTPVGWDTNPIDAFILEQLRQRGLHPSPQADRRTLIRRLSFDLHGLPPSPSDVDAFANDPDPQAYERLVDRLLASPHYGEQYARHWLDIAHYADTHGFERDMRRDNAWRYRDYVIDALNIDKPYNRFLQEQIAGDVLWPDDEQAVVATGFLAAGPWDHVGQEETKSPELRRSARSLDLDDMVTQVMTACVAMTINCARCHDHKLDPISQQEYYQLRAVFAGVRRDDRITSATALEQYEADRKRLTRQMNAVEFEIGRLEGRGLNLADIVGGGNGLGTGVFRQGIDSRTGKVQTRDFGKLGNVVTNKLSTSDFPFVDGVFIPDGQDGQAKLPVTTTGLTVTGLPTTSGEAWDMMRNGPVASQHSPELDGINFTEDGHTLLGLHANAGITFDLAAIRNSSGQTVTRLTAQLGYFGATGDFRADAWIFVDGKNVAEFRHLKRADGLRTIDIPLPKDARFLTLISTDGKNGIGHDQVGFGDPLLKSDTVPDLTAEDQQRLAELRERLRDLTAQRNRLGTPPRFFGVVAEQKIPEVHVLRRGDPESPVGEPLSPAALSAVSELAPTLGDVETPEGERRAALVRWITAPTNPLTPRVIMNRMWQWHFGQGIVSTPSDFGFGGGAPSHPELLDWLAAELQRRNGSLKSMHRLILTSATYRQLSSFTADNPAVEIDADNRLLWRQNTRRIAAETVRDTVLAVSGNLNLQRGGPGFEDFEYQDAYAPIYTYVTADKPALWRRSIYRYIVRTTPNRFLTTLDCPDPANLTPVRSTTTTPLQSLALYNNDFMLQQADDFANRVRRAAGSDVTEQVRQAFRFAFGREPTAQEIKLAAELIRRQNLFVLCRSLFNANEFVYVD